MVRLAETPSLPLSLGLSACFAPAWWELLGLSDENLRLHSQDSANRISLLPVSPAFSAGLSSLKSCRLLARANWGANWSGCHHSHLLRAETRPALPRPVITPVISLPANPIDASRVGP